MFQKSVNLQKFQHTYQVYLPSYYQFWNNQFSIDLF